MTINCLRWMKQRAHVNIKPLDDGEAQTVANIDTLSNGLVTGDNNTEP